MSIPDRIDVQERLGRRSPPIEEALAGFDWKPRLTEHGEVDHIEGGVVQVSGLPGVQSEELLRFPNGCLGLAYNLDHDRIGVILLDDPEAIDAGDRVRRTGRVVSAPVGEAVLGRVIDPAGRSHDGLETLEHMAHNPIERPSPSIIDRAPVDTPLQTGIKAIDALIPIGRGQRELILGDRQTGKTAIAVDAIINQRHTGVLCVYCAVGQRSSTIAKVVDDLRRHRALRYTVVVATTAEDPAGLQFVAPYAATTMAEYFRDVGRDVLIVYDDLTRHARAYRELSLLLRRPPGREAYPGDIFYIHSRLLERSAHLAERLGGGSMTALPIIETQAENLASYIPTNLISITDGQIFLSARLFRQGQLPAIDVARSVSRVGGRAQLPAYRGVVSDLRLAYAQFEELERFSRYGARLEESRQQALERGRRVRQVLRQHQYSPLPVVEQIAALVAVTGGALDEVEPERVSELTTAMSEDLVRSMPELFEAVEAGRGLTTEDVEQIRSAVWSAVEPRRTG